MNFFDISVSIYLETLVEWVFEYYVFALALFWKSEKRSHFPLRLGLGLALILGIGYPLAIFFYLFGGSTWGRALTYILLFGMALVHLCVCFKKDVLKVILVGDFAYLVQNAAYNIFVLIYSSFSYLAGGFSLPILAYKGIYYAQFLLQVALAYRFLISAARKRMLENPLPNLVIAVSAFTVLVTIVLTSLHDIHIQAISEDLYNSPTSSVFFLRMAGYLMSVLLDGAIIVMIFSSSRSDSLRKDISDLQYLISQSEKQYELSEQTIEAINIKCHDMKHRINSIVGDTLPQDALKDINDSIAIYDAFIDTGNKTLDVVLTEKSLSCETLGIAFTRTADGSAIGFMSVGDVFCLFGNLLDNAIEAARQVEEKGKRYIDFSLIKAGEGIAKIECANYFQGERTFVNGLPKTTKEDALNHGFGMKSIQEIVKRYNGSLMVKGEDNIFSVSIVFYALE